MSIENVTSLPEGDIPSVLLFWAPWHGASCEGGPVDSILKTLSPMFAGKLNFGRLEAEACHDLAEKLGVSVIPTVCFLDASNNLVEKIDGCDDAAEITQAVKRLASRSSSASPQSGNDTPSPVAIGTKPMSEEDLLNERLKNLIESSEVMLFMKGSPGAERCGFSRQIVELLREHHIAFGSFDILSDDNVRQGLKTYSDWPTYPQVYAKGELIGGLDILREMAEDGDVAAQLHVSPAATPQTLEERLKELINRQRIVLFMKGLPSAPKCGFSRQIVEILDKHSAAYDAFNILEDDEVRQGLKTYSDWPTFPQLYIDGDLVGGLDIVKEMEDGGDLDDMLKG
mmetsp:Transcript_14699/g.22963  ORF Transcript_14699/g.22963 Transcript_14699/m.22963 type:complete len:341 (+) Transcript_14699:143-1165(+)|eukprot:CAMPEP_0195299130 /NCGR_PEP_ID=MMETSP0707-20130614/24897_1 /TAXON_ID=33640 /ORGANISM="Asterionellopsis glacialis, Strain CCMP134" /LENGTH=340 /DNA_ID=CAMNT_0040361425 /DNA_START=83 /DNA_END=1105 /DNA_ORIENTATION=+